MLVFDDFPVLLPNRSSVVLLQFLTSDDAPGFTVDWKEFEEKSLQYSSEEKDDAVQFG